MKCRHVLVEEVELINALASPCVVLPSHRVELLSMDSAHVVHEVLLVYLRVAKTRLLSCRQQTVLPAWSLVPVASHNVVVHLFELRVVGRARFVVAGVGATHRTCPRVRQRRCRRVSCGVGLRVRLQVHVRGCRLLLFTLRRLKNRDHFGRLVRVERRVILLSFAINTLTSTQRDRLAERALRSSLSVGILAFSNRF